MPLEEFQQYLSETSQKFFSSIEDKHFIQHITHLDTDGITSGSIVIKLLQKKNCKFVTSVLPTLDPKTISSVFKPHATHYIFSDLGSGQLSILLEKFSEHKVLILDHHEIEDVELPPQWLHVNPRMFDVDGSSELSASGVCYMFAKATDSSLINLSHLGLLGATGDMQEKDGEFPGANGAIVEDALKAKSVEIIKTLKYYGVATKPLQNLLEYSKDIKVPGVTGQRGAALQFLSNIGIDNEIGGQKTHLADLSEVQFNKLVQAMITARKNEPEPTNILTKLYEVPGQPKYNHTRNLKEYSALLNACGRLKKYAVGIGTCLGDPEYRDLSNIVYGAYKQKISDHIRWFKQQQHERSDNYIIINGGDYIPPTMIGTLASIVAQQPDINKGTYIVSVAKNTEEKTVKLSMRVAGDSEGHDLNEFIRDACDGIEGVQAGGHSFAAGAVIPYDKEEEVIQIVKQKLDGLVAVQ